MSRINENQKDVQTPNILQKKKSTGISHHAISPFGGKSLGEIYGGSHPAVPVFKNKDSSLVQKKENNTGLPDKLKSGIENLSGFSMNDIRVHYNSDKPAQLQAHAYAQGTDIHLASGQEKQLPHEAWHVVQQKQGRVQPTLQMKGKVNVNDDKALEREADVMGAKALQMKGEETSYIGITKNQEQNGVVQRFWYGDVKGTELLAVRATPKITDQNTIADLPTVTPVTVVDDSSTWLKIEVDTKNKGIVLNSLSSKYMTKNILTGYTDGKYIGKVTDLADTHRNLEGKYAEAILSRTKIPTKEQLEKVTTEMSTEVKINPSTGKLPKFNKIITDTNSKYSGQDYEKKLFATTEDIILWQYNILGKDKAELRKDSKNLHKSADIDNLASVSKEETDKVFGGIKKGPALKFGKNIFDGWEDKEKKLVANPKVKDEWVDWRVQKIIEGVEMSELNKIHGAVQKRDEETKIINRVKRQLKNKYEDELLQTHLGWGGFADKGNIYLQRYKSDKNDDNRQYMWSYFETIIHEYIHTLEHDNSMNYSNKLLEKSGGKVIREGFTDYFTNIVWSDINFSDTDFRKKVEGSFYDKEVKGTPKTNRKGYYKEADNAKKIADIIGYNNLVASYFLGRTDLIKGK